MSEIFDEIRGSMPPLRGVVHAAGVLRDAALINQRPADGDEVRRGKVEGAWILHDLTRDIPLDFFVLYSAAGVVLGAPGQGMYAAANAELDALAHFRQSIGLPATSVAWGPWGGAGMAADLLGRGRDVFAARGLKMIDPEFAFSQLERLLADGGPYGAVISIDWAQFLSHLPDGADRGYFSLLASASKPRVAVAARTSSLERLKAAPAGQRHDALAEELAARARHVIGLRRRNDDRAERPRFANWGFDSLMAVELRNVLVRLGGQSLPATLLFDYPHLEALTSHLYRAWGLDFDAISDQSAGDLRASRRGSRRSLGRRSGKPVARGTCEWRRRADALNNAPADSAAMSPIKQALAEIRSLRARLASAESSRSAGRSRSSAWACGFPAAFATRAVSPTSCGRRETPSPKSRRNVGRSMRSMPRTPTSPAR